MSHLARPLSSALSALALFALVACGGDDAVDPPPDEPKPDASVPREDARVPNPPKPDARVDQPSPTVTLDKLAGKYLMRFDTYGTTQVPSLSIKSRVSQLWVVELSVEGDKLKSSERLCTQQSKQVCAMGCSSAETVIDPKVITDFIQKRTFERSYTLAEDGTFTGERSVAALGYDDPSNGNVPMKDDPKVWDINEGGAREGLLTTVTINDNSLFGDVNCTVFGAQKLVSTFSGALEGTADEPEFPSMKLVLDDSAGRTLSSTGGPACGGATTAKSPVSSATARLVRYDTGSALDCGDLSDFDELLPAEEP